MIRLQETIRELKNALRRKIVNEDSESIEASKPYHLIKADEKIEELTRATVILSKAKEKDQKVLKLQKKVFDKNVQELAIKVEDLEQKIKEKDKEIKI